MKNIQRFWCYEASNIRCVREEDYDAAKAELAMLRKELANIKNSYKWESERAALLLDALNDCESSLAAAEQRNEALTTLLREGLEESGYEDDWIDRVIEVLRDQPTESGASE